MLRADELSQVQREVKGKWVVARPIKSPLITRLKDAVQVVLGKAEAVKFYEDDVK